MRLPSAIAARVDTSTVAGIGLFDPRVKARPDGGGVQPQGCGVFDWIKCGGAVAGCVASCVENGPACIPQCVASVAPTCLKCL